MWGRSEGPPCHSPALTGQPLHRGVLLALVKGLVSGNCFTAAGSGSSPEEPAGFISHWSAGIQGPAGKGPVRAPSTLLTWPRVHIWPRGKWHVALVAHTHGTFSCSLVHCLSGPVGCPFLARPSMYLKAGSVRNPPIYCSQGRDPGHRTGAGTHIVPDSQQRCAASPGRVDYLPHRQQTQVFHGLISWSLAAAQESRGLGVAPRPFF